MLPPDEDLTAQGVQGLKEDLLDKTVKLNVEYKKGGRKLAKLVKEYEDAMARAKKNHLNIC